MGQRYSKRAASGTRWYQARTMASLHADLLQTLPCFRQQNDFYMRTQHTTFSYRHLCSKYSGDHPAIVSLLCTTTTICSLPSKVYCPRV